MIIEFIFAYMLLGWLAGLLAGLFGLGGGVIIVPVLAWIFSVQQFPEQYIMIMAIATSLATIIFTSVVSIYSHMKLEPILWSHVFRLIPGILLGAGIGAIIADYIDANILKKLFILYLCYVGVRMARKTAPSIKSQSSIKRLDYLMGNFIGLLSSILGIGGGTITVPYLVGINLVMRNAVAVSSVCGLAIALSGTVTYAVLGWGNPALPIWSYGYVYLPALCGIVVCSIFTAPLGAKLAHQVPANKLKRYFSGVIFLIVLKMIVG